MIVFWCRALRALILSPFVLGCFGLTWLFLIEMRRHEARGAIALLVGVVVLGWLIASTSWAFMKRDREAWNGWTIAGVAFAITHIIASPGLFALLAYALPDGIFRLA